MNNEPQKEHQWLEKLVGEWTVETEATMGPGKPPEKFAGTESVRSVGGLWVVCEGHGEMPGAGMSTSLTTIGYDPQQSQFVGTFVGSMMTNLWNYKGSLNPDETVLTLEADGPAMPDDGKMVEGKMATYQDVIEMKSDDHRVMTSRVLRDDGEWQEFMTSHYRRIK